MAREERRGVSLSLLALLSARLLLPSRLISRRHHHHHYIFRTCIMIMLMILMTMLMLMLMLILCLWLYHDYDCITMLLITNAFLYLRKAGAVIITMTHYYNDSMIL